VKTGTDPDSNVAGASRAAENRRRLQQPLSESLRQPAHRTRRSRAARPKEVRMIRREFVKLTTGSLIALGGSVFLVSCGGYGASSASEAPAAAPQQSGSQIVYTTSVDDAHFHTFAIDASAFASPPAEGLAGSTSNDDGHTHPVTVSMADLQSVTAGQTIKVTTGSASSHTHVLTLVKIA
jgi:hypothetical protein